MRNTVSFLNRLFLGLRSRYYLAYYRTVYGVEFGKDVRVYSRLLIHGPGKVVVGAGTHFTSRRAVNELCTTRPDARLQIGENCLLNGAVIGCAESVIIGNRCIIAEAYIRDTTSHGVDAATRHIPGAAKISPVELEENVWVGSHCHVMPGVRIGENSVLGVNSVATKSIPSNVFAAGCPARVIHALNDVSKPEIEELQG